MTAGLRKGAACVQLAACVGEQRHRSPFGLDGIQYFLGRGEGGARRCGGERGKGRGPLPTFKPRPPTRIHRSSKQTTLSTTAIQDQRASPTSRTYLAAAPVPSPSRPPPPTHRASHPNPIFRSRCLSPTYQPSQPSHSRPNHRRDPRHWRSDPNEPTSLTPNHTGPIPTWPLGRFPTPIILDTSDQTTSPLALCCWVAAVFHPPRPRRSNPRPDTTKNHTPPYQA